MNDQLFYDQLVALRRWLEESREAVNEAAGQELINEPHELLERRLYVQQPIADKFRHLLLMRQIREEWDHLVRTYEDAWNCAACLHCRAALLQKAVLLMTDAALSCEHREAKNQAMLDQMNRQFARLTNFFKKVLEPQGHDEETQEDEDGS